MAARHAPIAIKPQPDQDVATKRFCEAQAFGGVQAFARSRTGFDRGYRITGGQRIENLIDQCQTLLAFANPDPHPRIDVAGYQDRNLKGESVIGRITRRAPRIERASASTADIAAGT